ncbi:MAG: hypothetical protein AABX07_02430 [Nanoarchaeota archaeon]
MDTTIQISGELLERLKTMKIYSKESYETIIWDLVEDRLEFSKETKRNIEKSKMEIKEGKTISLETLKRKMGV